jgi:hypothetical protein
MPLVYTDIDVNGKIRPAVVIEGVGDSAKVIFKSYLTPEDQEIFDQINDSTGANFKAKFEAFVHPNGRLASDLYKDLIKEVGRITYNTRLVAAARISASEILELQDAASETPIGDGEG